MLLESAARAHRAARRKKGALRPTEVLPDLAGWGSTTSRAPENGPPA
ncbi:hypothetical protein ATKI12_8533 [Kitasatospora sp. Ki12]